MIWQLGNSLWVALGCLADTVTKHSLNTFLGLFVVANDKRATCFKLIVYGHVIIFVDSTYIGKYVY